MAFMVILSYLATRERLLEDRFVRCQEKDSDGVRVLVGFFDPAGLNVSGDWDADRDSHIGLSSSRKPWIFLRSAAASA